MPTATLEPPPPATEDRTEVSRRIEDAVDAVGADVVLAEIKRSCVLLYVTVRAWRGQYLMRNADVVIDGRTVDAGLSTKGQWKVIPEEWHKALQKFESRCRTTLYRTGVSFKDGVYIIPQAKAKGLVAEIKAIRAQYRAKVAEFAAEWPGLVDALQARIVASVGEDQWLTVSNLIPSAEKLPKLFDIEIGLWPVGGGGGGTEAAVLDHLTRAAELLGPMDDLYTALTDRIEERSSQSADLTAFVGHVRRAIEAARRTAGKLTEEHAEAWMAEAQAVTNRMVAAAVEAMVAEPVREFAEQVDNLAKLTESRTVRAGTLDAVRRAYEKLAGFQFMLPAQLVDRLRQVELRIGAADPRAMNSGTVAGQKLNEALRAIRDDLASDVAQLDAFGQFARNLDI